MARSEGSVGRGRGGLAAAGEAIALAVAAVLVVGVLVASRNGRGLDPDRGVLGLLGAGAAQGTPEELKQGAASTLEAALASPDGITFEVAQTQTLTARPGGPKVAIPDPNDRHKTLAEAETYEIASLAEFGVASGAGFYAELRDGPTDGRPADPKATLRLQALVRDGKTFRNDGRGWFETDQPPGIGLDPVTVRLLPQLLRQATGPKDAAPEPVDGATNRAITASGTVADIPGVVAADGAAFTKLSDAIMFAFDGDGRLVKLRVTALNTNAKVHDLVVATEIVIRYGGAGDLPAPEPTLTDPQPEVLP